MSEIVTKLMEFAVHLIHVLGYPGVFIAGSLEFIGLPISGEVLIMILGVMVKKSDFSLITSFIIVTLGSIVGTLAMYGVGRYFNHWASNYIRKKLVNHKKKLDNLNKWMKTNGSKVGFFSRFLPFVRVYVSLVAGVEKVPVVPFTLYSSVGIGICNLIFLLIGYYLGGDITKYKKEVLTFIAEKPYTVSLILFLIALIIFFIFLKLKNSKKK